MELNFSKYTGLGNDFIFIDNRKSSFPKDKLLISKLCHRQKGIGADGVILLENTDCADFSMQIFNADGSSAEMCGNGARCFMKFLKELGFSKKTYKVWVAGRILDFVDLGNLIKVEMGKISDLQLDISLDCYDQNLHFINTGVPHVIAFVENRKLIDINKMGKKIRFDPYFSPKGTNVNFIEVESLTQIAIRTYERGVEGETLACGTGATASAIIASVVKGLKPPIKVKTASKESLLIDFSIKDSLIKNVAMTGEASFVFKGLISV